MPNQSEKKNHIQQDKEFDHCQESKQATCKSVENMQPTGKSVENMLQRIRERDLQYYLDMRLQAEKVNKKYYRVSTKEGTETK